MPDTRFYPQAKPLTADAIAQLTGGVLARGDGGITATGIATPIDAGPGLLVFAARRDAVAALGKNAKGFICLTTAEFADSVSGDAAIITVADAKAAFGLALRAMFPAVPAPGVHPTAAVDDSAEIGDGCSIDAGAHIGAGCVLGRGVSIGANSVITHALIGDETIIGPLTAIGSSGFGIARDGNGANFCLPHLGRVVIGKGCNIAAHCAIDRGLIGDTVLGDGVMIDNQVQIGHNCRIGDGTVICGQSGLSGSVTVGRNNVFGAASGVADHVTIGDGNMFAAKSGVTRDIGDGRTMAGFPAVPAEQYRREVATLRRLAKRESEGGEK